MDSFTHLLSSYECFGMNDRSLFNFITNDVLYYFNNVFAFQVPHQALLASQPILHLRECKSSKDSHLSFVTHIGNRIHTKIDLMKTSIQGFKNLLRSITATKLDTSIHVYQQCAKIVQDVLDSFVFIRSSSETYHNNIDSIDWIKFNLLLS
jgi:hypothetical protein